MLHPHALQAQVIHPLLQLLSSPWQASERVPGEEPLVQQPPQQARRKQLFFPLQLSPSGARSLLFANFWVALLQDPLRCDLLAPCSLPVCSFMCKGSLSIPDACTRACGILPCPPHTVLASPRHTIAATHPLAHPPTPAMIAAGGLACQTHSRVPWALPRWWF